MLRAVWRSVVCFESGLEFSLLLPTTVIFPEIFTPLFLCKAETVAQLLTLPSAGKNGLFVFISIDSSGNLLVMVTKQCSWDHKSALKTCKRGCELDLWSGLWECRTASARAKPEGSSPLWPPPPAGWTNHPSNGPFVGQEYDTSVAVASVDYSTMSLNSFALLSDHVFISTEL